MNTTIHTDNGHHPVLDLTEFKFYIKRKFDQSYVWTKYGAKQTSDRILYQSMLNHILDFEQMKYQEHKKEQEAKLIKLLHGADNDRTKT